MMGQPTTRLQVSGHRFLMRRMEHALVRGDIRMLDDPLRAQALSLTAGAVLALIAIAVCAVLAFVRPGGTLGDAPLVMVRESGALYVRIDDVMHPVYNLASARLILGSAAVPRAVSQQALDHAERGPQVGIPGAPEQLSPPLTVEEAIWTVCDDGRAGTSVLVGRSDDATVAPGSNVLVTPRGESAAITYLLHGGWRSRVDLRHPAVVRALRLDGVVPQKVSGAVLTAIPEAPAIQPPIIAGVGAPGPSVLRERPIGTVVAMQRPENGAADYFVVLADGLQRIGEVTADLIRLTNAVVNDKITNISADVVGALPVVTSLPVTTYPERAGVVDNAVVCARWLPHAGMGSHTTVVVGDKVPGTAGSMALAQQDDLGPAVDSVSVPAGRSVFVRSVGLTGDGQGAGSLFLITDRGVLYGVRDGDTAGALGITVAAVPAPWPVLATLPRGPELDRGTASLVRDGLLAAP